MVFHDYRCEQCGKVFERRVSWDSDTTLCDCGSEAQRVFLSHREYRAQSFDPVLVYRDAGGHYSFPGRNHGPVPKGKEPIYLTTLPAIRKFENQMSNKERERYFAHKERQENRFAPWIANARSELRQKMQHMSAKGRAFAEAAMQENDRHSDVDTRFDPGCHFEAFSQDSSNRDAHYDVDMKRGK